MSSIMKISILQFSILFLLFLPFSKGLKAQCGLGEVEITVVVYSYDVWAEESYWELVPEDNGCGNGTLLTGGSEEVGCAGNAPTGENGIPDYGTEFGQVCVPDGQWLDLIFVDWYGDGGLAFDIFQDGIFSGNYYGGGLGNTWSFQAGSLSLPEFDSPCGAVQVMPDQGAVTINTSQCVAPFSEIEVPGLHCNLYGLWCEGDATNTAWAYFIAEENVEYRISTCHSSTDFDTQVAVWHGTECVDSWSFELISANDDSQEGCNEGNPWAAACYASCLIPGDVYYIMVDGYYGQTGNVGISVSTVDMNPSMQTQVNDMYCPLPPGQAPNASIYVSVYGSGTNFECNWTGPNGFDSEERLIFDLQPGIYNLIVTTTCGEIFEEQYEITITDPWDVEITSTPTECPLAGTGSIAVVPGGATPGYSVNYFGPNGYTNSGLEVENLNGGNHTVVVTDSRGCTYQEVVDIFSINNFEVDLGPDTTFCLGENVTIFAPADLTYLWGDGSENQFFEIISEEWGPGNSALVLNATTEDGCTDTDVLIFTIEVCVDVDEQAKLEWKLYPNPASELLMIESNMLTGGSVILIYDQTGRVVKSSILSSALDYISIADLASGLYLIEIQGSSFVKKRFIKL